MYKPTEKMHARSKLFQVCGMCFGSRKIACYRTLRDEESGKTICMMMRWSSSHNDEVIFQIQETDELIHLIFEDVPIDLKRESFLMDNGDVVPDDALLDEAVFERIKKQLFSGMSKLLAKEGYSLKDDLTVEHTH